MADDEGVRDLLSLDQQDVLRRWVAAAANPLQGRLVEAELERTCGELLDLLSTAVESGTDVGADAYAGVRALLIELSRDWARRGFTPSQTASPCSR